MATDDTKEIGKPSFSRTEKELLEFDSCRRWNSVFHRVKNEASEKNQYFTHNVALRAENRYRNRYRDVIPYDHTRVKLRKAMSTMMTRDQLQRMDSDEDDSEEDEDGLNLRAAHAATNENTVYSDYINASHVSLRHMSIDRSYILTQGPTASTQSHFWLMVWENRCPAIVMLNRLIEKGALKCAPYFPTGHEDGDEDFCDYDDVQLRISLISTENKGFYLKRFYRIQHLESGECHQCIHFHYLTWPDFGVPNNPSAFLNFLLAVRRAGVFTVPSDTNACEMRPVVVHCSAGVGRSGTFVLADIALLIAEKNGSLDLVDLRSLLIDLRCQRMGLIQTWEQLRFSYLTVVQGAQALLSLLTPEEKENFWFPVSPEDCAPPEDSSDGWSDEDSEDDVALLTKLKPNVSAHVGNKEDILCSPRFVDASVLPLDEDVGKTSPELSDDLGGELSPEELSPDELQVFTKIHNFVPPAVGTDHVVDHDLDNDVVHSQNGSNAVCSSEEPRVVSSALVHEEVRPSESQNLVSLEDIRVERARIRDARRERTRQQIQQMQERMRAEALDRHRLLPHVVARHLPNTPPSATVWMGSALLIGAVAMILAAYWYR